MDASVPFPGIRAAAARLVLSAVFLVSFSRPAASEIYRWVDEHGTVHFTDELSGIPASERGKARLLQREPPVTIEAPSPEAFQPLPASPPGPEAAPPGGTGDPTTQAELLRAKIAAKEDLIKAVDAKRSLATNPLRNRFVSPADMDLYRKYQAELPGDRERLKELESRIDSLNR